MYINLTLRLKRMVFTVLIFVGNRPAAYQTGAGKQFVFMTGNINNKIKSENGGGGAGGLWMAGVVGGGALAVVATALAVCCYCRRRAPSRRTHLHLQQMACSNGAGSVGKPAGGESPAAGVTRLPGNWALPAGPRGYNAARPGRLRERAQR
ncbi:unnamed protein product [Parnassius apollo]|uniref:(apollo) hypothetical protein n=1 Tax=Parnassius apollo TaxID=110799 RepID=A0A8S3XYP6_PARAO|nr:unnamed protein product [Parnassius apollo]